MKRPKRLSASFVKTVGRPGRYGDGRGGFGLSLLVRPMSSGRKSKTWSQRLRINGKPFNMGLGIFPLVTLAEARAKAVANRRAIEQGMDPRGGGIPTFAEAAEKVIALHAKNWKAGSQYEAQWRHTLRAYAFPKIGRRRVNEITTANVMSVLLPIWNEKRVTATRVRQRIGAVMKWSVAKGYREDNPAGDAIGAALPRTGARITHHRALPHQSVRGALEQVRECRSHRTTILCFEFLVLTASRSGEARGARWEEIDHDAATWTVRADRMKMEREHRVPLSTRALDVLGEAAKCADGSGLVFPSVTGREISRAPMSRMLKVLGIKAVPHGFRSSFRDWCGDKGVSREVAEAALAHVVRNQTERAYARTDLFERRRDVMQRWAEYVSGGSIEANGV